MIYLTANQSRHRWVGHEEVARKDIFGDWKRFTYYVNGQRQYVYCRNQKVFFELFAGWCRQASTMNNRLAISTEHKYSYTLGDVNGVGISTEDIIMDNPDSKPFRVKSCIQTQ